MRKSQVQTNADIVLRGIRERMAEITAARVHLGVEYDNLASQEALILEILGRTPLLATTTPQASPAESQVNPKPKRGRKPRTKPAEHNAQGEQVDSASAPQYQCKCGAQFRTPSERDGVKLCPKCKTTNYTEIKAA